MVCSPSGSTRFQIFGLAKNASSQPLEVFTFPKGCTPLVVKLYLVIQNNILVNMVILANLVNLDYFSNSDESGESGDSGKSDSSLSGSF